MGEAVRALRHTISWFNGNHERRLDDRRRAESRLPGVGKDRCRGGHQVMTQMTGSHPRCFPRGAVLMTTAACFCPLVLRRASPVAYQRADRRTGQRDGQNRNDESHEGILS